MVRSVASVIPNIYLEKGTLASVRARVSLNFLSGPCFETQSAISWTQR